MKNSKQKKKKKITCEEKSTKRYQSFDLLSLKIWEISLFPFNYWVISILLFTYKIKQCPPLIENMQITPPFNFMLNPS